MSEMYADMISNINDRTAEREKQRLKEQRETQQKQFEDKILELADKVILFEQTRGEQDSLTILLATFLDAAIEMRDLMETMTAINVAMECLTEAISFMDSAINFDTVLVQGTLTENHGFFARMKARRQMKKAINNNIGRMKQVSDGLVMKFKMVQTTISSMSTVADKLKGFMAKSTKKKAKASAKNGTVSTTPSRASALLAERRAAAGGSSAPSQGASAPTASAPAGGVGDIGDIL